VDDERDDELTDESGLFDAELFEQDGPDLFAAPDDETDPGATAAEQPPTPAAEALEASRGPAPDPAALQRPDAPLALYRRYRPDTFADVIGQEHVTEPLQRALTNNRVNHAYLFSGPRGCGKTTSARILARALNCAKGPAPVPCGECQSCRDLARGGPGSIDVIEIDAASHGGVDDARDLRERAFFSPVSSRYKIYIVDEAHMVTTAGFNALLKVVEEPPPHVKFIFATTEPEKVIGTIRSRTHHYPFRLVPPKTLSGYLGSLCEAEGVAVDTAALPLVVRAGAGSVRDSLSVLDQLLGGAADGGVTYSQAAALLGYTPDALLDEIVDAFAAGDAHGVFACIDKVIEVGQDPRRFAEDLLRRLRDLIIVAAVPDALTSGLVDVAADQAERLRGQATTLGPGELTRAAEVLAVGLTEMRGTTAPRLHLELMCARVLLPAADANERGVHARLDRLERRLDMTAPEALAERPAQPARESAAVSVARQPDSSQVPEAEAGQSPGRERTAANESADAWPVVERATAPEPSDGTSTPSGSSSRGRQAAPSRPSAGSSASSASANPVASGAADSGAPAPGDAAPAPAGGPLTTADFRRLWPDILTEVKNRRRFTWILLSQNAHVVDVVDGVLSLGMNNAGARDSFGRGGSEDVLRESILQATATQVKIQVVIDGSGADQPTAGGQGGGVSTSSTGEVSTGSTDRVSTSSADSVSTRSTSGESSTDRAGSSGAAQARQNIRSTSNRAEPTAPEVEPSRDDESIEEESANHDELLAKHLGAELIAEEN